jgi:hypothetical protein
VKRMVARAGRAVYRQRCAATDATKAGLGRQALENAMAGKMGPGEQIFGDGLPGTRGDFLDETDTEGHGGTTESSLVPKDGAPGPERGRAREEGSGDGSDVEGHLYAKAPSSGGEFTRRGPGENPNGER